MPLDGNTTVVNAVLAISAAERARYTDSLPCASTHFCDAVSQVDMGWLLAFGSMVIVTCFCSPGFSVTFWKATRRFGGSPTGDWKPTYTWGTSAPARLPVFVTVSRTAIGDFPSVIAGVTWTFP